MVAQMALFEAGEDSTDEQTSAVWPPIGPARRTFGAAVLVGAVALSIIWLYWRARHLGPHPIELTVFAAELVSVVSGLIIGVGMVAAPDPRTVRWDDPREAFRFAFAVADIVGRTRASDVRVDLLASYRRLGRPGAGLPDFSMAAVLTDGSRRLVMVLSLVLALAIGVAPMPMPPIWAATSGLAAIVSMSCAHVLLGGGRIRFGDRVRWSSAALGEVFSRADRDGVAPRRWVGTVAAAVVLNLAIALRGMSDRWTHGLAPMDTDDRQITMVLAIIVVAGSLYTLRTTAAPQLANSHLVSRRTEEQTARQLAVGGAVLIGTVGLLAGVLPGDVDATDDPARVEQISDRDPGDVEVVEPITGGFDD